MDFHKQIWVEWNLVNVRTIEGKTTCLPKFIQGSIKTFVENDK